MNGRFFRSSLALLAILSVPLYPINATSKADEAAPQIPDKRIVDCLLQGYIRKLGNTIYQAPPRPVKIPAIDCQIRGGDFLVFDRASFSASLSHWLDLAKGGDVTAQIYVGEIFERGLGERDPDYAQAAAWYQRAAESGNASAQISLAQLYEKGLGVERNPAEAERLYKLAFGPGEGVSVGLDPVALDDPAEKIQRLEQSLATAQQDARALTAQLGTARQNLTRSEEDLRLQEAEEERLTKELQLAKQQLAEASGNDAAVNAAQEELNRRGEELREQQITISRLRAETKRKQASIDSYEAEFDRISELESALQRQSERYQQANEDLKRTRLALVDVNQRLEEQQAAFDTERRELQKARDQVQTDGAAASDSQRELERQLQEREKKLAEQSRKLEELRAKVPEQEDRSRELENRLSRLNRENAELARSLAEASRYREEARRLKSQLEETQEQLASAEAKGRERQSLERMESEIKRLRDEADSYRDRIDELETREETIVADLAGPSINLIEPAAFNTRGSDELVVEKMEQLQIIGKVSAPAGVLSLTVNQQPTEVNQSSIFSSLIPLTKQSTPVRIVAIDSQGKRAEQFFRLINKHIEDPEPPIRPPLPSVEFGNFHALLIGNADYEELPDLVTPRQDVSVIDSILRERYGFKTTVVENGSREEIMNSMYELLGELTTEDNLLIYYAGHGDYVADTNRGVWLPVDASPASPANWISNVEINDYLKQIRAKQIVVIADSCYSGALTRSAIINLRPGLTDEEYESHLKKMAKIRARVVLTSGALAPVLDSASPSSKHSIFASALIDILQQNNAVLSAQDLGRTIAAKVSLAADRVGYEQEPQYAPMNHANHQGGDFFFVPVPTYF
jgi:hypothetical protein